ncbi:MAG: PH domain-containing protein [Bacilli bacterium]
METVYSRVMDFKRRHSGGVSWRIKKHCEIIEKHLNPGEEVIYAFTGQKNNEFWDIFTTCAVVLTNKRLLIGQKRVVWGYFLGSITPDLYNDLQVYQGLIWGKVTIDTVKEVIVLSNLPKSSLDEIETYVSEFMMKEKQKYMKPEK